MTGLKRFWFGGSGALLPLLITLIGADLAVLIDQHEQLSSGMIIGAFIRYLCLFILGGFVAALHSDEKSPLKLAQLGIAAPALITSYISVGPVNATALQAFQIPGIISTAHAADRSPGQNSRHGEIIIASGFFSDVLKGWSQPLDRTVKAKRRSVPRPAAARPASKPKSNQVATVPVKKKATGKTVLTDREKQKQALLKKKLAIEKELKRLEKSR